MILDKAIVEEEDSISIESKKMQKTNPNNRTNYASNNSSDITSDVDKNTKNKELLTISLTQNDDSNATSKVNDDATTTAKKETKITLSALCNNKNGESCTTDNNGSCANHKCHDARTKNLMSSNTATTAAGTLHSLTMIGSTLTNASFLTASDDKNKASVHHVVDVAANKSQWDVQKKR